jgi:transketolase
MVVLSPCDSEEARKATIAAAATGTPVYIRLAREKTPLMTTAKTPFEIGKSLWVWKGKEKEVAIFATGPLLYNALLGCKRAGENSFNHRGECAHHKTARSGNYKNR